MSLETLAKHSRPEKIASIVASRIIDYINMGAHPEKLIHLFNQLGLDEYFQTKSSASVKVSALIKHYVSQEVRIDDLRVYESVLSKSVEKGFKEFNKTFITKVKDDMLVWSPLVK